MMCVVKSECFRIDSGVRQVYIMFPWLFNAYMDAVMEKLKIGMGEREWDFRRMEESRNCLTFCMQMTWFCVMSQRKT